MIKTLIFDFGDVFINLNKTATKQKLHELGVEEITSDMLQIAQRYEVGAISTKTFVDHFTSLFPNLNAQQLIEAWNAIILDFPEYRLQFIEQLADQDRFNRILLSNTNALHIERVIANMTEARYQRFKNCFHQFYLSHQIGLRKPNTDIFRFVLNENGLNAEACLFIDDTLEHINAAASLGLHTWHVDPKQDDIVHLFEAKKQLF